MIHGFLNLSKPAGMSSHDCVSRTRRLLGMKKVGHGGTLDPKATGVLPIGLGHGTRFLNYLPTQKAYKATIRFGVQTSTDDLEGDVVVRKSAKALGLAQIKLQLPTFIGNIMQVPPKFSAIQIDGKRQYQLARKGVAVDIPARSVKIDGIDILEWRNEGSDHPELVIAITCGPGTYIRSIARDLGQKVGYGATLAYLERTLSCGFHLNDSLSFEELEAQITQNRFKAIPFNQALVGLPTFQLDEAYTRRWYFGQRLPFEYEHTGEEPCPLYLKSFEETPLGIGWFQDGVLSPKVVIPKAES